MKKLFVFSIISIMLFSVMNYSTSAWEQPTHKQINREALNKFFNDYAKSNKYKAGEIDESKIYYGPAVIGTSSTEGEHQVDIQGKSFEDWTIHGGFSADEPNLYASVRHFYDPLAVNGVAYLTDQVTLHYTINPGIDAKIWALTSTNNPYSWANGLLYYKKAMEIPVGFTATGEVVSEDSFRGIRNMVFNNDDNLRNHYLAMAYRSLGETMHLLADMAQPAHVRNDSHPYSEPIEQGVNAGIVKKVAANEAYMNVDFNANPDDMFKALSSFTNKNFYSSDTIYDKDSGYNPSNWENPYPSPQFKDLTRNNNKEYSKSITGEPTLMMGQTFLSYYTGAYTEYHVPASFAYSQAKILIPLAIKGNEKLIDEFFPTMNLTLGAEETEVPKEEKGVNKAYTLAGKMVHDKGNDTAWKAEGLDIKFAGEASLMRIRSGKESKIAVVGFENGEISQIQDTASEKMKKGPLKLYAVDGEKKTKGANYYVNDGDKVYLEIRSGGRIFKSEQVQIQGMDMTLDSSMYGGTVDIPVRFEVKLMNPPKDPVIQWEFGDGKQNVNSTDTAIEYTYKEAKTYNLKVRLYGGGDLGKPLIEKTLKVIITTKSAPEKQSPTENPELTDFMKKLSKTNAFSIDYKGKHIESRPDANGKNQTINDEGPLSINTPQNAYEGYKFIWTGNKFTVEDHSENTKGDMSGDTHSVYSISGEGEIDPSGKKIIYFKYTYSLDTERYEYGELKLRNETRVTTELKDIPLFEIVNTLYNTHTFKLEGNVTTDNFKYLYTCKSIYAKPEKQNNNGAEVREEAPDPSGATVKVSFWYEKNYDK